MDWHRWLARHASRVEDRFDRAKAKIGRRLLGERTCRVVPYRGYGTVARAYVRGRVLFGDPPGPASPEDRWWHNLASAYRRIESDDVSGARVRVAFQGTRTEAVADEEGHFTATLPLAEPPADEPYWQDATIELVDPDGLGATAPVAIPTSPRFGVISDLDDTVLKTGARNLIRMVREVIFGNAHTRIPFEGVGAFYRALHTAGENPIFYVSSSPWSLYDVLSQFLHLHRIPAGPMELRDWGISSKELLPTRHGDHKRRAIDGILAAYPDLRFILMGDSGQEDPEIYRGVVHDHPERVLGIYIRNVSPEPSRAEAIGDLARELSDHEVDLILVNDTLEAARHAADRGWVDPGAVHAVAQDRARERTEFD